MSEKCRLVFYVSKHHHRYWYNNSKAKVRTSFVAHGALCRGVAIPIHFHNSQFYLCSGTRCRHSQIVSQAEIRLGDKPATDSGGQLQYLFNYQSFADYNLPILRLLEFRQFPENIQIYGGHTEQIECTAFRKILRKIHIPDIGKGAF